MAAVFSSSAYPNTTANSSNSRRRVPIVELFFTVVSAIVKRMRAFVPRKKNPAYKRAAFTVTMCAPLGANRKELTQNLQIYSYLSVINLHINYKLCPHSHTLHVRRAEQDSVVVASALAREMTIYQRLGQTRPIARVVISFDENLV